MKFNLSTAKNLSDLISKLSKGLNMLSFEDNMSSFLKENVRIEANSFVVIPNELTFIPKKYIIVAQEGNGLVTKHKLIYDAANNTSRERDWDLNNLYLKNNGNEAVIITVIFLR